MKLKHVVLVLITIIAATNCVTSSEKEDTVASEKSKTEKKQAQEIFSKLHPEFYGRFETGIFDESACEIVAYHAGTKRIFCVNANSGGLIIIDASNPASPTKIKDISFGEGEANSVAVNGDLVAIAVNAANYHETSKKGHVVFTDLDGNIVKEVEAGYLPDMVTFTKDGKYVLAANEGEPSSDYSVDPIGSVTIIKVSDFSTKEITFSETDLKGDVRITGPEGTTVSQDIEPEYITVSPDGRKAFVACQENNAIARIDITTATLDGVFALGYKDHNIKGNGMDFAKDGEIKIENRPTLGMYMPDSVASFEADGKTYVVTANEGDDREYGDYEDATKVKKIELDPVAFSAEDIEWFKHSSLRVSKVNGDENGDSKFEKLYTFGGRSFTIFDEDMNLVFDSGDQFERTIAELHPETFGCSNTNLELESRIEKKSIEPEALTVGKIGEKTYAFIGLERDGGIMIYDITTPKESAFITYLSSRKYDAVVNADMEYDDTSTANTGDLAPEGMAFVPAENSPTGKALLIVGNEVSGTVSIYQM
ncbi:MAG: choice-of-anchor I family protein [Spirochaetales bacterium]|nr:choice-of-anchor I family protein [Spirochaetales bacterium]